MSKKNKNQELIVVCHNDYPQEILPEGATDEQATAYCARRFERLELERKRKEQQGYHYNIIYVHWHKCPIVQLEA